MDKIASELLNLAKGLVAASSVVQRNEVRPFVKYVMEFYNEQDGVWPIAGLTGKDVLKALKIYEKEMARSSKVTWGGGDSLDRERIRDIILKWRKMAASKEKKITKVIVKALLKKMKMPLDVQVSSEDVVFWPEDFSEDWHNGAKQAESAAKKLAKALGGLSIRSNGSKWEVKYKGAFLDMGDYGDSSSRWHY